MRTSLGATTQDYGAAWSNMPGVDAVGASVPVWTGGWVPSPAGSTPTGPGTPGSGAGAWAWPGVPSIPGLPAGMPPVVGGKTDGGVVTPSPLPPTQSSFWADWGQPIVGGLALTGAALVGVLLWDKYGRRAY